MKTNQNLKIKQYCELSSGTDEERDGQRQKDGF